LLVIPSLWEASPLQPMEAMAAGIPVLGTDCIGLREVLADTPSRMVRAADPAALADGLRTALRSPWTAEAREYAAEHRHLESAMYKVPHTKGRISVAAHFLTHVAELQASESHAKVAVSRGVA